MEKPILNPSIPYIGPVYGGKFGPKSMVQIQGTVSGAAYRFDINLQCGPETTPLNDIAIQVSVRILDGCIVLNSLKNGIWGEELGGGAIPIKCSEMFEFFLICDSNQYKVIINGQHYCDFPQRIHYDHITHLAISGDVSINKILYKPVSEDVMGVQAQKDVSVDLNAPAPLSVPPVQKNESDGFIIVDLSTLIRGPSPAIHTPPPHGFIQPSPVEISNQSGFAQSNFQNVKSQNSGDKMWFFNCCGFLIGGIILIFIMYKFGFTKKKRKHWF